MKVYNFSIFVNFAYFYVNKIMLTIFDIDGYLCKTYSLTQHIVLSSYCQPLNVDGSSEKIPNIVSFVEKDKLSF